MLILSRKVGESIAINGCIRVTVQAIRGHQVRLGIEAPEEIKIFRQELLNSNPPAAQISSPPIAHLPLRRRKAVG